MLALPGDLKANNPLVRLFGYSASFLSLLFLSQEAFAAGSVSIWQDAFLSPAVKSEASKNPSFIGGDFQTQGPSTETLNADLSAQVSPGNAYLSYLNLRELYWRQEGLTVGRRKMPWSEFDSSFNLGFYQPVFEWNQTQTETQGLSGLFVEMKPASAVTWGFTLFASKFYLPNQGSNYEVKDGRFENSNPYFHGPATQIELAGQTDPLNYTLQKPETSEVIFQNSFAARLFLGEENSGPFAQIAIADKPSNKLALGIDGENQSAESWNGRVKPQVYLHQIASFDAKYSFQRIQFGVGALKEKSREPVYTPEWTYYRYSPTTLTGIFVSSQPIKGLNLRLEYLRTQGGEEEAVGGKLAPYVQSLGGNRVPFTGAIQVSAEYQRQLRKNQSLSLRTRVLREEKSLFTNWVSGLDYQFERFWTVFGELQLISASEKLSNKNIFYTNRANDSASLGVSYVF